MSQFVKSCLLASSILLASSFTLATDETAAPAAAEPTMNQEHVANTTAPAEKSDANT